MLSVISPTYDQKYFKAPFNHLSVDVEFREVTLSVVIPTDFANELCSLS